MSYYCVAVVQSEPNHLGVAEPLIECHNIEIFTLKAEIFFKIISKPKPKWFINATHPISTSN